MKMRSPLVLAVLVAVAVGLDVLEEEWLAYKAEHGKSYGTEEDLYRRGLFLRTKRRVEEHNTKHAANLVSYTLAVNHFADLTSEETRRYLSCISGTGNFDGPSFVHVRPTNATYPDEVDWRSKGAVTAVKNQGVCGSCWAFSAIGALEGSQFIKTGNLVALSEQNLVDCDTGNFNCGGGYPSVAYTYIQENGVDTEASYPYDSLDGVVRDCRFNKDTVGARVSGMVNITRGSEADLQHAVATVGPISVAIDAGSEDFHYYSGGVFYDPACSPDLLNHAVTLVGYGTQDGQDYWLVKNSWGPKWGDHGYIKMSRNKENHCGIATLAVYPVV